MRDLLNSMVRFSAAMTLFSFQQMQNVVGAATADSDNAFSKFKDALDSVTNAITNQMGDSSKPAMDSMTRLGSDLVDRTMSTLNVSALDPRELMQTSGDLLKKTSESLADLVKRTAEPAGEPKAAAETLVQPASA